MTLLNKSIRYYVDFDQWGINAFNSNPIETTKGFNEGSYICIREQLSYC